MHSQHALLRMQLAPNFCNYCQHVSSTTITVLQWTTGSTDFFVKYQNWPNTISCKLSQIHSQADPWSRLLPSNGMDFWWDLLSGTAKLICRPVESAWTHGTDFSRAKVLFTRVFCLARLLRASTERWNRMLDAVLGRGETHVSVHWPFVNFNEWTIGWDVLLTIHKRLSDLNKNRRLN